jgi:hypothetical protein
MWRNAAPATEINTSINVSELFLDISMQEEPDWDAGLERRD